MVLPRVHNIMNSWYYSELNKYTKCWLYVNLKFYMDAMFYHHSQLKKYRQNQEDHSNLLSISIPWVLQTPSLTATCTFNRKPLRT